MSNCTASITGYNDSMSNYNGSIINYTDAATHISNSIIICFETGTVSSRNGAQRSEGSLHENMPHTPPYGRSIRYDNKNKKPLE
jgi:hypothetical protein